MKWILIDAESKKYLDVMFEPRNWDNVEKKVEMDDLTLLYIKRTPEEKRERPYMRKDIEVFTEDRPCPSCINGTMENEGRLLIGDRRDFRYECNNCSTEMSISIDTRGRQWSKKHKEVCIIDEGSAK